MSFISSLIKNDIFLLTFKRTLNSLPTARLPFHLKEQLLAHTSKHCS